MKHNRVFLWIMLAVAGVLCGCRNGNAWMTVKEETAAESEMKDSLEAVSSGEDNSLPQVEDEQNFTEILDGSSDSGTENPDGQNIYVYVCGHVNHPGVYAVSAQARICDAIALAGGISEDGCGEALHQAEHMTDGETIYVPGIDEAIEYGEDRAGTMKDAEDDRVNINTASKEELMTLPGIGESKADTIVQYRDEHGAFTSIEGLMEIPGIKEGVYNKIKEKIKI